MTLSIVPITLSDAKEYVRRHHRRIAAARGRVPLPIVEGEQHRRFEDTLP